MAGEYITLDQLQQPADKGYVTLSDLQKMQAPADSGGVLDYIKRDLSAIPGRVGDLTAGAVRGAGSIGATVLAPVDAAARALGVQNSWIGRDDRREAMDAGLRSLGADTNSTQFGAGKIGAEIAGTAGIGGALGNGVRAVGALAPRAARGALDPIATALETGGFRTGMDTAGAPLWAKAANVALRAEAGAAVGGASAGLVNPDETGAGVLIGGGLPMLAQASGAAGSLLRNSLNGGGVSPEVKALADRAQQLGIPVPADRLVSSKPLDALASSLNYVPFSGRSATEDAMAGQLNRRLSNTFGQDSPNITMALRKANDALGGEFERVLSTNGVQFDQPLLQDLASVYNKAENELGPEALKPIAGKISEIMDKGQSGVIDGQAAYNIKRDLDRLGQANTPNAFHALELKSKLMDALNRSLGPDEAAAFATTRQQYGNMLQLEKLAKNGAEGDISVARLANMRNINNPQMQELADIAAQFVKPREGAHGAAQRVYGAGGLGAIATGGGLLGGPIGAVAGPAAAIGAGRIGNALLNGAPLRNFLLNSSSAVNQPLGLLTQGMRRSLPLAPSLLSESSP